MLSPHTGWCGLVVKLFRAHTWLTQAPDSSNSGTPWVPRLPRGDKSSGSCPLNVRATTLGRAQEVPGDPEGRWSSRPATGRVWAGVAARVCLRFHTIKGAGRASSSNGTSTRGRPETTHDAPALPDFFVEESWGEEGWTRAAAATRRGLRHSRTAAWLGGDEGGVAVARRTHEAPRW